MKFSYLVHMPKLMIIWYIFFLTTLVQVALSGPSVTDCCCSILLFSAQCTPTLGGLRSAMEYWETVDGPKKTTKIAGQGHGPSPWGGLLGGTNRRQGERSGGKEPNNGATRHGSRGISPCLNFHGQSLRTSTATTARRGTRKSSFRGTPAWRSSSV